MANIEELLEEVKLSDPESLLKWYPHTNVLQRLGYLIEFVEPENNLLKTVYDFLESERFYPVLVDINDKKGKVILYPVLIVNDPIFNSGYSFLAFRKKFITVLEEKNVEIENNYFRVMPLAIINISELQDMEQSLKDRDQTLFNILKMHFSLTNTSKLTEETKYNILKNFSHVINNAIPSKKHISKRITTFSWLKL